MSKFEIAERKGRDKMNNFLTYYNFTDLEETKNLYDRVDYYATSPKRKDKCVFEIKDRDLVNKYTGKMYEDILLESSKVEAVKQRKKDKNYDKCYYACFSNNDLYLFNLDTCPFRNDVMYLPKSTMIDPNDKELKKVHLFNIHNSFHFSKDETGKWKLIEKP